MKKIMFLLVLLLFPVMVYAEDYNVKTLIPVDTKASVKTEKFDYNNFVYNSKIDEKGNSLITFESIKNVGFLTYCTDKDYDSNYSAYKLMGNASSSFSIKVVSKYFVNGKSTSDVKYISVLDSNEYCQVGGYEKYKDLTLDEIINGVAHKDTPNPISKFISDLQEKGLMQIIIYALVGLAVLVIIIMIISAIFKKIKDNRLSRPKEEKIDVPMEETVDLTYEEVKSDDNLDSDENISMGEVNNTLDDDDKKEEENKEDGSDLTKFFN